MGRSWDFGAFGWHVTIFPGGLLLVVLIVLAILLVWALAKVVWFSQG